MLAEARSFFNGAIWAFCEKAYGSNRTPGELYASKDEMKTFIDEQVKKLSSPMEIQGQETELFTFLDTLFRTTVTTYDDLLEDEEIDSDQILTWNNCVSYDFFLNVSTDQIKFLDQIKYKFSLDDFERIASNFNQLSAKKDFNQEQWFLEMGPLFSKYKNLRSSYNHDMACHSSFPIEFKSSQLKKDYLDFLIKNGVKIFSNETLGDAFGDYLLREPELVEHLLKNHSELFGDIKQMAAKIVFVLKEFFIALQHDILPANELYIPNLKLLKQSLKALEKNGFDLRKPVLHGFGIIDAAFFMLENGSQAEIDGEIFDLLESEKQAIKKKLDRFREDLGF